MLSFLLSFFLSKGGDVLKPWNYSVWCRREVAPGWIVLEEEEEDGSSVTMTVFVLISILHVFGRIGSISKGRPQYVRQAERVRATFVSSARPLARCGFSGTSLLCSHMGSIRHHFSLRSNKH